MDIKINDKVIPKSAIADILKQNKLAAIIFLRTNAGIGLKDAKEIIDKLDQNIDHYDGVHLKTGEVESFQESKEILLDLKEDSKRSMSFQRQSNRGSHILPTHSSKRIWFYIVILVAILLFYFLRP
ncbi:hypothetical protein [Spongiivirga citrea]|uniref:Ribosomal protein L7/L12 C-terminal domain-containing protein n=1 Tax=Spongiivirga citrea TaxID=1481457 RepID=A0A6M0CRB5_9FLAO|nr:hypothetical protein [Spongiivirga citrea]NER16490.1 hypothetical protein [Spongiivirga citrea]